MGRAPCCAKEGLRKGPWSAKEDMLLTNYIKENGEGQWKNLPKKAGIAHSLLLGRRGNFSQDEEDLIIRLHSLLGNRWSLIAGRHGRTDNEIKHYLTLISLRSSKLLEFSPKSTRYPPKREPKKSPKQRNQERNRTKEEKDQSLGSTKTINDILLCLSQTNQTLRNSSVDDVALSRTSSLDCSDSPEMLSYLVASSRNVPA
ncbi:hypothetical protein HAX54_048704 [Datura stramonium]|uniref:Uncharacterized protein n=1 Tax=Datura stramonium TaxID=4076 RepID=A0ABS8SUN4_DATST|nr:hypothetical protein [Datura stramonium]